MNEPWQEKSTRGLTPTPAVLLESEHETGGTQPEIVAKTHPEVGLQESVVQALLSLHTTAVPPQTLFVHTSLDVHALPSLQATAFAAFTQAPVAESQESEVQTMLSSQLFAVLTQAPAAVHESVVQALLSLQVLPTLTQLPVTESHESVVQVLPSSQFFA